MVRLAATAAFLLGAVSTVDASGLSDAAEHCGAWAASGECVANREYMLAYCAASCAKLGVTAEPAKAEASSPSAREAVEQLPTAEADRVSSAAGVSTEDAAVAAATTTTKTATTTAVAQQADRRLRQTLAASLADVARKTATNAASSDREATNAEKFSMSSALRRDVAAAAAAAVESSGNATNLHNPSVLGAWHGTRCDQEMQMIRLDGPFEVYMSSVRIQRRQQFADMPTANLPIHMSWALLVILPPTMFAAFLFTWSVIALVQNYNKQELTEPALAAHLLATKKNQDGAGSEVGMRMDIWRKQQLESSSASKPDSNAMSGTQGSVQEELERSLSEERKILQIATASLEELRGRLQTRDESLTRQSRQQEVELVALRAQSLSQSNEVAALKAEVDGLRKELKNAQQKTFASSDVAAAEEKLEKQKKDADARLLSLTRQLQAAQADADARCLELEQAKTEHVKEVRALHLKLKELILRGPVHEPQEELAPMVPQPEALPQDQIADEAAGLEAMKPSTVQTFLLSPTNTVNEETEAADAGAGGVARSPAAFQEPIKPQVALPMEAIQTKWEEPVKPQQPTTPTLTPSSLRERRSFEVRDLNNAIFV
eukprot:TRINITY_DN2353_c0_g1_i1.p1 TRINITY_DN2353_c0_g1~~TRINITY_DN2353_c0_g1_i1.p1  ORF type:complete len:605 (-),score=179.61 TRINITY_DN2353_c0_g1_i1:233-2047(-)